MPVIVASGARRVPVDAKMLSSRLKPASALADGGTDEFGRPLATGWRAARARIWALFDDPTSSKGAQHIAIGIMTLIVVSVTTFCLETLPALREGYDDLWFAIEAVSIGVFTVEYTARLLTCPQLWPFLKAPLNVVDLVAILPFYAELLASSAAGGGSGVFRVVRLVRVFRVFKVSRYLTWVKMFANALSRSAQPLGMLIFIMAIGCVFFSSAIYFAERGAWDDELGLFIRADGTESPFSSIPASFWWCIITMTTVGYGDMVPITFAGRLVAVATSLAGILVLAIPITVISTNFTQEYEMMKREKEMTRRRLLLLKNQFKLRQRGLEALQDELEDLVNSSSADFRDQVADIVEVTRSELSSEVKELVRIAYECRAELHEQYIESRNRMQQQQQQQHEDVHPGGKRPGPLPSRSRTAEDDELSKVTDGSTGSKMGPSKAKGDASATPGPPEALSGPPTRASDCRAPAKQRSAQERPLQTAALSASDSAASSANDAQGDVACARGGMPVGRTPADPTDLPRAGGEPPGK